MPGALVPSPKKCDLARQARHAHPPVLKCTIGARMSKGHTSAGARLRHGRGVMVAPVSDSERDVFVAVRVGPIDALGFV